MESRAIDAVREERDDLHRQREAIFAQQKDLEEKLADIDRKLRAYEVFEAALRGQLPVELAPGPRRGRGGRTVMRPQSGGGRRMGKTADILEFIKAASNDGISRTELLDRLGAKGDKRAEQSLSNSLYSLRKQGLIQARERGVYYAA